MGIKDLESDVQTENESRREEDVVGDEGHMEADEVADDGYDEC